MVELILGEDHRRSENPLKTPYDHSLEQDAIDLDPLSLEIVILVSNASQGPALNDEGLAEVLERRGKDELDLEGARLIGQWGVKAPYQAIGWARW